VRIAVGLLLGALLGLGLGWALAPRHQPAPGDREAQLRHRATEFYRASRTLDKLRMSQLFTPARQQALTETLLKEAENSRKLYESMTPEVKREMQATAQTVQPDKLELRVEGDWAVTTGPYVLHADGNELKQRLDETVWVYDRGDWWVFGFHLSEYNTYGNPPDFALQLEGR
jgi:hypothetical protein